MTLKSLVKATLLTLSILAMLAMCNQMAFGQAQQIDNLLIQDNGITAQNTNGGVGLTANGTGAITLTGTGNFLVLEGVGGNPGIGFSESSTRMGYLNWTTASDIMNLANEYGIMRLYTGTGGTEAVSLQLNTDQTAGFAQALTVGSTNATEDSAKLDVYGTLRLQSLATAYSTAGTQADPIIYGMSDTFDGTSGRFGGIVIQSRNTGAGRPIVLALGTSGGSRYWFNTTGLGIFDDTPSYALDVNGTGRFVGNLLADSDFTAGNAVGDIFTASGQARGMPHTFVFSAASKSATIAGGETWRQEPIGIGGATWSETGGICMPKAGSIIAISGYAESGTPTGTPTTIVAGVNAGSGIIGDPDSQPEFYAEFGTSIGSDDRVSTTQARGVDTFSAGDGLQAVLAINGDPTEAISVSNLVILVIVQFDT